MMTGKRLAGNFAALFEYNLRIQQPAAETIARILNIPPFKNPPRGTTLLDCFRLAKQLVVERSAADGAASPDQIKARLSAMVGMRNAQRRLVKKP